MPHSKQETVHAAGSIIERGPNDVPISWSKHSLRSSYPESDPLFAMLVAKGLRILSLKARHTFA